MSAALEPSNNQVEQPGNLVGRISKCLGGGMFDRRGSGLRAQVGGEREEMNV